MDPRTLALLLRLREGNIRLSGTIPARLEQALRARWRANDSWSDADMVRLIRDVEQLVAAAERRTADQTVAYLAAVEAAVTGRPFRPVAPDKALSGAAIRGVAAAEMYTRPQMVLNYALSQGKSLTAAVKAGEDRLVSIGLTNAQLVKTHTVVRAGKAASYRRVLVGAKNCALCVIASTQRYNHGGLMPIHPGCNCGEEPVMDGLTGQVLDPDLLEATHAAIEAKVGVTDRGLMDLALGVTKETKAGQRISDFTELMITREHGELGPVLTWRSDKFRDAAEAASLAA